MTLFWKAERSGHGSELPKVALVYLETAEPIYWYSKHECVRNDFAYIVYRLWRRGGKIAAVRRRSEILAQNADFGPREALNNVSEH